MQRPGVLSTCMENCRWEFSVKRSSTILSETKWTGTSMYHLKDSTFLFCEKILLNGTVLEFSHDACAVPSIIVQRKLHKGKTPGEKLNEGKHREI